MVPQTPDILAAMPRLRAIYYPFKSTAWRMPASLAGIILADAAEWLSCRTRLRLEWAEVRQSRDSGTHAVPAFFNGPDDPHQILSMAFRGPCIDLAHFVIATLDFTALNSLELRCDLTEYFPFFWDDIPFLSILRTLNLDLSENVGDIVFID